MPFQAYQPPSFTIRMARTALVPGPEEYRSRHYFIAQVAALQVPMNFGRFHCYGIPAAIFGWRWTPKGAKFQGFTHRRNAARHSSAYSADASIFKRTMAA